MHSFHTLPVKEQVVEEHEAETSKYQKQTKTKLKLGLDAKKRSNNVH